MNKSLISLAVAAGLSASSVAHAAPTAYGFLDASINSFSDATNLGAPGGGTGGTANDLGMSSNTSAFGLKGSEDLGDGVKAIYKMEFQVDLMNRLTSITDRDQYVGLKGGMGTVKVGSVASNYKQMGKTIDPFYRTVLQARSVGQQSSLHRGAGIHGGRLTNAVQYTSPNMGGIEVVANVSVSGATDESAGVGVRYTNKSLTAWVDTFSAANPGPTTLDSATKIGAKFQATKEITIGAQFENVELVGGADTDVFFLSGTLGLDKNNTIAVSYGSTDKVTAGFSVGVWHKLSKMTSVYAAANSQSEDTVGSGPEGSIVTVGLRKKF